MKFNLIGFVMMIIAIAVGQLVGSLLVETIGGTVAGTIFGSLMIGFVCYLVFALITKSKIRIMDGVFFAVLVFFATFIAGYVGSYFALGGSDLVMWMVTGGLMYVLWSWIGGKSAARALGVSRRR